MHIGQEYRTSISYESQFFPPKAHLAEWQLHIRLFRPKYPPKKNKSQSKRRKPSRRWSAPSLAPLVEVSESSSGIATPVLAIADEAARRGIPVDRVLSKRSGSTTLPRKGLSNTGQKTYGSIDSRLDLHTSDPASSSSESLLEATTTAETRQSTSVAAAAAAMNDPAIRRTCLGLAVAYGGASGTLSGACLLFAKSGVELLVLTIEGDNQFDRWQSWFLVATMLAVALLQLWYLNKSLRLADPTLVCPLAFCFYNTSSIMLGLVYFDQLGSLSALHLALVVVGIAVLLAGVWTVSMHGSTSEGDQIKEEEQRLLTNTDGLLDSPLSGEPASILSPVEAGNPTEMDALLANVGGIGGPHLPPMSSSAIIGSPQSLQQSELPTSPTSPTSPKSPKSSSISSSRGQHSRARTRSGSFIAGLGMRVPGLPVQSVRFEEDGNDNNVNVEAGGAGYNVNKNWRGTTSADGAKSREGSPQTMRSKRHFYETLLERGLSIGISPSSPGFHLRHSFEEDLIEALQGATDGSSSSNMPRRNPRRTFSEADVDAVMAERDAVVEVQQEEAIQEQEQASSAWTRVIPAVDYHALSDRLSRLGQDTSGWFGGFFRTRNPESTA